MKTHDEVVKALIKRSGVRAEVERIEREEGELPSWVGEEAKRATFKAPLFA